MQKIAREAAAGVKRVDLLFRVWLRSGEERWVLIHIEVQAQPVPDFPERLHDYNQRIKDFYGRLVVTFAVLADDEPGWRPGPYVYDLWGCGGEFHYPTVKLLDFADRVEELEKSDNPFAVVFLAHLKARETAGDTARRRQWKVRLLKGLYRRGWAREDVRKLLTAIDWFLTLPRDDDRLVREEIEADEKEKQMPYITSFEQMAMEEGEARGEAKGLKDGISVALRLKFGEAGKLLIPELRQINDVDTLKRVTDSIEAAATVDDVRRIWSGS